MSKARIDQNGHITFKCPACAASKATFKDGHVYDMPGQHSVPVRPHAPKGWAFNGDLERPTLTPSLKVTYGEDSDYICHFFVRNGQLKYCGDCTHEWADKTIPMEAIES